MDLKSKVQARLDALGLDVTEAARRGRLERNYVRDIVKGRKTSVHAKNLEKLAIALECDPSDLVGDDPLPSSRRLVPIVGYVGADPSGKVAFALGQRTGDYVPIPPGGSDKASALEVKGFSMPGYADNGSIIYFERQIVRPGPELLGHAVVVETTDDEVLVKRIRRGSRPDVFDLESINGPTLYDCRIRWVAPITTVVQPIQAQKIIVRAGEAA